MQGKEELIRSLIRKQKGCEFSLRFFLQRENDPLKNVFALLKIVKGGPRPERNYDYGEGVLEERLLTIRETSKTI